MTAVARIYRWEVAKLLGTGKPIHHDFVSYMGGRLEIVYSFHAAYTGRVQALITTWPGFETPCRLDPASRTQPARRLWGRILQPR